jgi:hypothetical protein
LLHDGERSVVADKTPCATLHTASKIPPTAKLPGPTDLYPGPAILLTGANYASVDIVVNPISERLKNQATETLLLNFCGSSDGVLQKKIAATDIVPY